ncbi:hypothetical protein FRC08_003345 [Ceratobasidium sp. 394]|nr:hypothetical protein FRC08_003345 [Ceratobasidium sp. 394]
MPPKCTDTVSTRSQAKSKAAAAPPAAETPETGTSKRGGRPQGTENWTIPQLKVLFKAILHYGPTGQLAWGEITNHYNQTFGPNTRESKFVRQKYQRTLDKARKKPTGGTKLDWRYKIALKVEAELSRRSAIRPINDRHAAGGGALETPEFTESDIDRDSGDKDEDEDEEGGDDAEEHDELSKYKRRYEPLRRSHEWEGLDGSEFKRKDDPMADAPGTAVAHETTTAPPPNRRHSSNSSIEELPPPYKVALSGPSTSKTAPKTAPKSTPKSAPKPTPKPAPKPVSKLTPTSKSAPAPKPTVASATLIDPFATLMRKKPPVKGQPLASSPTAPAAKALQPTPKAEPSKGKGKAQKGSSSDVKYLPCNITSHPAPSSSKKRKAIEEEYTGEARKLLRKASKVFDTNTQEDVIRMHMEGTFLNSSMFQLQDKVSGLERELRDQQAGHERELREEQRLHAEESRRERQQLEDELRKERQLRNEEHEKRIVAKNTAARSAQQAPSFNLETLTLLMRMFGSNTNPLAPLPTSAIPPIPAPFAGGNSPLGVQGAVGANQGGFSTNVPSTIQQLVWTPPQVQQALNTSAQQVYAPADGSRAGNPAYTPVSPIPMAVDCPLASSPPLSHVVGEPSDRVIDLSPAPPDEVPEGSNHGPTMDN